MQRVHVSPIVSTHFLQWNVDATVLANNNETGIGAITRNDQGDVYGALFRRLLNPYPFLVVECIVE